MSQTVDWATLSKSQNLIGELESGARLEASHLPAAQEAIAEIVGSDELRSAVDFCVTHQPGSELARSVLWLLHPWAAMERCFEIYQESENPVDRQSAVELLRVVADRRVLKWIEGFLNDPDELVQFWGIGIVDQLAWSSLIDAAEARSIANKYKDHRNPRVCEHVDFINQYLDEREAAT